MKTVFKADDGIMANLICGLLNNEGIPALVNGEYLTGAFGEFPVLGQVRVVVDENDYEQAQDIIRRFDAGEIALPELTEEDLLKEDEDPSRAPDSAK